LVLQFCHFSTVFYNCFSSGNKRKGKTVNSSGPKAARTAQSGGKSARALAILHRGPRVSVYLRTNSFTV
jgi:hypothetical protein